MLEKLINEYTTGENFELPKDYFLMRLETIAEYKYNFNGQDCKLCVEVNKIIYDGRKRKNYKEYDHQVITINLYDKDNCQINEFNNYKELRLVSKIKYDFINEDYTFVRCCI